MTVAMYKLQAASITYGSKEMQNAQAVIVYKSQELSTAELEDTLHGHQSGL